MGWWPFGRKRRKNDQPILNAEQTLPPHQAHTLGIAPAPQTTTINFASSENLRIPPRNPSRELRRDITLLPQLPSTPRNNVRRSADLIRSSPIRLNIEKSPHLRPVPESELVRSSSLRSLRSESNLFRRLSTKKRTEDIIREAQLKGVNNSTQIPKRVSEDLEETSKIGSKRYHTGRPKDPLNRDSVASLQALSMISEMASISDHTFNVGSFDILSPHPTFRHSFQGHRLDTGRPDTGVSYNKRTFKQSDTVDELADTFDAGTLRKLMERDQRRKERKAKAEAERARRRLQQHSERTEMVAPLASRFEYTIPVEAGPSAPIRIPRSKEDEMFTRTVPIRASYPVQDPFADPPTARTSIQIQPPTPGREITTPFEDPIVRTAQTIRYSQASLSPPSSPMHHARNTSSLSGIPDLRVRGSQEMTETSRSTPDSNARRSGPLAALFRKSVSGMMKGDEKPRPTESSFSNTSRESMSRQLPPAHLINRPITPRTPVNAPLRTKSRFIEDLSELPLSPPDSRMQSPMLVEQNDITPLPSLTPLIPIRNQSDSSPLDRTESRTDSYDSTAHTTGATLLSQSLASVDSEGSWLSGKPSRLLKKKSSGPLLVGHRPVVITTAAPEDIGAEIETFRRVSVPQRNPARNRVSAIRAGLAINDDGGDVPDTPQEQDEQVVHGEVTRKNTVIHQGSRVRSTEGLLKQWGNEEPVTPPRDSEPFGEEDSPGLPESPYLGSAHARHLSAGSARLLDIPAKRDSQRSSVISYVSPTPERVM